MVLLLPLPETGEQTLLLLYRFPYADAGDEKQPAHHSMPRDVWNHFHRLFLLPRQLIKLQYPAREYWPALVVQKWLPASFDVCCPRQYNIILWYCFQGFGWLYKNAMARKAFEFQPYSTIAGSRLLDLAYAHFFAIDIHTPNWAAASTRVAPASGISV